MTLLILISTIWHGIIYRQCIYTIKYGFHTYFNFFSVFLYVDFVTLHIVSMFFNVPCRTACWFMFRNTKALQLFGWIMMLRLINYLFSPSLVVYLEYISILISKAWGQLFRILKCTLHSKQQSGAHRSLSSYLNFHWS